jgi:hypothetical protein
MTNNRLRVWRTARERSWRRFREGVGVDITLGKIGQNEALDVREMYWEVVRSGQI